MIEKDLLTVLSYPDLGISLTFVYLEESIQAITEQRNCAQSEKQTLHSLLVSTTLISTLIQHEGELTLQARNLPGNKQLVAKYQSDGSLRGLLPEPNDDTAGTHPTHPAQVGLTYFTHSAGIATQSLISPHNEDLSKIVETYLTHTATLPFWTRVEATDTRAVGIMLKQESTQNHDNWTQLTDQFNKITDADWLLHPSLSQQLTASLSTQTPDLIQNTKIRFSCQCDREKMHDAIRLLGETEALEILQENTVIEVTCHYCQKKRSFSETEVKLLFSNTDPDRLH